MPDNTVTKVITRDKFFLSREVGSRRCWGKMFLADSGNLSN